MDEAAGAALDDFVIVAHAGPLEAKAALLAASLRDHLGPSAAINIAVPGPPSAWAPPTRDALALFAQLDAAIVPIENPIGADYPHGNKLGAMASFHRPCVFLDSDMIMTRPLRTHWSLQRCDAALKYADLDTFQRGGGNWRRVCRLFDLEMPRYLVRSTDANEIMFPYYNAGFIWTRNGAELSETWIDTACAIDASSTIGNKRPWLDQIALPVALARLGWTVSPIPAALNFPGHLGTPPDPSAYIIHYHKPKNLSLSPPVMGLVRRLLGTYPSLAGILSAQDAWAFLNEAA